MSMSTRQNLMTPKHGPRMVLNLIECLSTSKSFQYLLLFYLLVFVLQMFRMVYDEAKHAKIKMRSRVSIRVRIRKQMRQGREQGYG